MASDVKFPEVQVQLVGMDGNAFSIIGRCCKAARRAGLPKETISEFQKEATAGDYNHVLATCIRWFDVM